MKKLIPVAVTVALAFATIGVVQARAADVSHYSQTEVRQLIRDARTVEQYKTLASYFRRGSRSSNIKPNLKKRNGIAVARTQPASRRSIPVRSTRHETAMSTLPMKRVR